MKNTPWLRFFFLLVLIQALSIGRSLIWPELITINLPWPATPLNARFIAALYWMGAVSALLCMFTRRYAEVRIPLIQIGFVTGVLLLLTLPHLPEFIVTGIPYRWLILYTIDPLLVVLILWYMRHRDHQSTGRNALTPLFSIYAAVLAIIGVVLLIAPGFAAMFWPWTLPPILAQVYSVFFLTIALGGALATREPLWEGVWVYVVANLVMLLLIISVSLYHAARFNAGPTTWVWYGVCLTSTFGFVIALARRARPPSSQGVF